MLPAKVALPAYWAVRVCDPALRALVVIDACPPASRVSVPSDVTPSKNSTVPVGVPAPEVTVAVIVTDCPKLDGLGEEVTAVVVLAALTVSDALTPLTIRLVTPLRFALVLVNVPVLPGSTVTVITQVSGPAPRLPPVRVYALPAKSLMPPHDDEPGDTLSAGSSVSVKLRFPEKAG